MAKRKATYPWKRRTREHVIADLSVNFVERQALLCGFVIERFLHDYGLDLWLKTFSAEGEVENGFVMFQLKATDRIETVVKGQFVVCRVLQSDLRQWLGESEPVILILYDATNDQAYWLYVQHHFETQPLAKTRKMVTHVSLRIPRTNVVDVNAMRQFAQFRDHVLRQLKGVVHHDS